MGIHMKLVTVSGPPSSGKTSVIIQLIQCLDNCKTGVVKFDCLTSFDQSRYEEYNIPVQTGFSGKLCPDHYFITNIPEAFSWGLQENFDLLITESAGLCNRCSPHIRSVLSLCVIDNLSGINTPRKIGPMLKFADIVVVTKGDIVSQAEREVFGYHIRKMNPNAKLIYVNGITGQGAFILSKHITKSKDLDNIQGMSLRFTTPAAICSYCTGERMIGLEYQLGPTSKMEFK